MKILLLAYFYPPYLAAGASRAGQLAAEWRTAGAQVIVLAGTPGDIPRFGDHPGDVHWIRSIEVNVLPRLVVGRSVVGSGFHDAPAGLRRLGDAYRQVVNFPDGQIGWFGAALREARRVATELRPDVIVSTSPPATAHLVGLRLSRSTRIPWVAELRDPWTDNPNFKRWVPLRHLERRLEDVVLRSADAVVAVTPGLADRYRGVAKRVEVMTNGFTPSAYPPSVTIESDLVLHVGTVYPSYDFETLFTALRSASRPPMVRFVGRNLAPLRAALAQAGGALPIEIAPAVARHEVLGSMRRAWANLAFVYRAADRHGAQTEYAQQKFYEYVGARRPIIAVGPSEGDGARMLESSGLTRFARDAVELRALFDDRSWSERLVADDNAIAQYSYPRIAQRYLELLDDVSVRGRRAR